MSRQLGVWRLTAVVVVAGAAVVGAVLVKGAGRRQEGRLSPHESNTATIDGATITITYGRPYMRGRKIFGGLVPFGEIWMPGADEATIMQTSKPLQFASASAVVPAGSYSLYTLPSEKGWQLIINRQTGQWHTEYDQSQDLTRVPMQEEKLSGPVEQLLIHAVKRPGGGGAIELEWERTGELAPFTVK